MQLIKFYILSYLGYRFVTEFIRPEAQLWYGLTGYQWACLALAPVFAGLWVRDSRGMATSVERAGGPLRGDAPAAR